MSNYSFQPPYFYSKYSPRVRVDTELVSLDAPMSTYVPLFGTSRSDSLVKLFLLSILIGNCEYHSILKSLENSIKDCTFLLDIQREANNFFTNMGVREKVGLYQLLSWEDVLSSLGSGLMPIIGGSVYSSFITDSSYVPLPKPNESLLDVHVFGLLEFDSNKDLGKILLPDTTKFRYIRGSYIRNLNINKDFFVVKVENARNN